MKHSLILIATCCTLMLSLTAPIPSRAADAVALAKKPVTTAADLPAFTYKVPEKLDALLDSEAAWASFAAEMRANFEGVLRDYAIEDRKTRQQIELDLMLLDLDANRNADAAAHLARVIELEDKPEAKVFIVQTFPIVVVLDARRASSASEGPVYHAALARAYATRLAALPDSASTQVARMRGIYELVPPNFVRNLFNGQFASLAKQAGNTLDDKVASELLWMRTLDRQLLTTRAEMLPAVAAHLAAHPPMAIDIWAQT